MELPRILADAAPDVVVDVSGEPVVPARRRLGLVAICLAVGIPYEAPGVRYEPPVLPRHTAKPTAAVVATGKRTGKTAISGALARHAAAAGRTPIVVAMGRGGPAEPTVIPAGTVVDVDTLVAVTEDGGHAASDFYEDAVMTGVTTIGCRRVGDGPAGTVADTNFEEGMALVERTPGDLVVLEGSGSALPPSHPDAVVLVVPAPLASVDLAAILPLSVILADLVVVTFADDPGITDDHLHDMADLFRRTVASLPRRGPDGTLSADDGPIVAPVALRPHPLGDVAGRRVFFATTAPERAIPRLVDHLEEEWKAEVVGVTSNLANRPRLEDDLEHAPDYDVLLTELKAAAVDVAVRSARGRGAEAMFCDNRPVRVPIGSRFAPRHAETVEEAFDEVLAAADRRRQVR
jgi:cyclic 2,3-diphosphoglycerate synthase